jgi:hypothetical protein
MATVDGASRPVMRSAGAEATGSIAIGRVARLTHGPWVKKLELAFVDRHRVRNDRVGLGSEASIQLMRRRCLARAEFPRRI